MAERRKRHTAQSGSQQNIETSWDRLAQHYDRWVGRRRSKHHRKVVIPAVLDLLDPQRDEWILDIGAGQGILAPHIARAGAHYVGIDASPRLVHLARRYHGHCGRFIRGDARRLADIPRLQSAAFDGVVLMLSIQDMDPLSDVLKSAAWALKPDGRVVILVTHPCFRVPRQSGWGWDAQRKLGFRRIDRYLSPLSMPVKRYLGKRHGFPRTFHRPLHEYINNLAACGLLVERVREISDYKVVGPGRGDSQGVKAMKRVSQEIPLFLGLRAIKVAERATLEG